LHFLLVLCLFRTIDHLASFLVLASLVFHFRLFLWIFLTFVTWMKIVYIFRSKFLFEILDLCLNDFLLLIFFQISTLQLTFFAFLYSFLALLFVLDSSIIRLYGFILIIFRMNVRLNFWFLFQSFFFIKWAFSSYQGFRHSFFLATWNSILFLMNFIFLSLFCFRLLIYTLFI
jgi:hypothetical protein